MNSNEHLKCTKCGHEISEGQTYCPSCGQKQTSASSANNFITELIKKFKTMDSVKIGNLVMSKKILVIISASVLALIIASIVLFSVVCSPSGYDKAVALFKDGKYSEAKTAFIELGDSEECSEMIVKCDYHLGLEAFDNEKYAESSSYFKAAGDYKDSKEKLRDCGYLLIKKLVLSSENNSIVMKTSADSDSNYIFSAACNKDEAGNFINSLSLYSIETISNFATGQSSIILTVNLDVFSIIGTRYDKNDAYRFSYGGQTYSSPASYSLENLKIDPTKFNGLTSGSTAENSNDKFIVYGTELISFDSSDGTDRTRNYQKHTVEEIKTLLFVVEDYLKSIGYAGNLSDLGFTAIS